MLFDIHFIIYVYLYFKYNLYVLTMNPLPKPISPALHSHNMPALIFSMSTTIGYEPAGLTVHPPPQNDRGWVHFFVWVSSVTKIFS